MEDRSPRNAFVHMIRPTLDGLPAYPAPAGYGLRTYQPGDEAAWVARPCSHYGEAWGRIHWVALMPQHHGRGLARSLLAAACQRLRDLGHQHAYLTTSTARIPAINLYLSFGFQPEILCAEDEAAWESIRGQLKGML